MQKKVKPKLSEQGITLVALIIAIILLILLASITIKTVVNIGLINLAEKSAKDYMNAQEKESNTLKQVEEMLKDGLGEAEGLLKFENLIWDNKQARVTITKLIEEDYKIEYKVEDKEGNIVREYKEIKSGEEITELNLEDTVIARLKNETTLGTKYSGTASLKIVDITKPIVTVIKGEVTTKSIAVSVTSIDNEAGMPDKIEYKYYIKKNTDINYPEEAKYVGIDTNYVFKELEQSVNYDIKITTKDIAGNEGYGEIKNILTGTVPSAGGDETQIGAITFGNLTWSSGKASVTITKNVQEEYKIQFKVTNSSGTVIREYQEIESGGRVTELNLGDIVIARLTDGVNYGSTASLKVTDITKPTVTVTKGTVTTKSIAVSVTSKDNESGLPSTIEYKYYIKKSSDTSYPSTPNYTGSVTNYTFQNLQQNINYDIKVTTKDKAGNEGYGEIRSIMTGKVPDAGSSGSITGAIAFGNLTWSGGKASVTITKNITDNYKIQYRVTNSSGTVIKDYQEIASGGKVTDLNLGDTVTARLTDGVNYGNTASLKVTDVTAPSAPTVTVTTGTAGLVSGYYRSNITITMNVGTDNQSGVKGIKYKVTGANAKAEQTVNTTTSTTVTITTDGSSTVTAYTVDKAGNTSSAKTLTVNKDTVAPTISSVSYTAASTTSIKITPSGVSDTGSGVYQYVYYVDGTAKSTTTSTSYTASSISTGTHTVGVAVKDKAGNTSTIKTNSSARTQQYAWSKWSVNVITTYEIIESSDWLAGRTLRNASCFGVYSSYVLNQNNGRFNGSGTYTTLTGKPVGTGGWRGIGEVYSGTAENDRGYHWTECLWWMEITGNSTDSQGYYCIIRAKKRLSTQKKNTNTKGSYNFGLEYGNSSGCYTKNGEANSYWYVYEGIK